MVFRRCLTWGGVVLLATPLFLSAPPAAHGQDDAAVAAGRSFYVRECASCHGDAATGYGPAWSVLREPPPDLTVLSAWDRPFDASRIKTIVTGHLRRVPPHWPSQMPYWAHARESDLDALVAYLESVQRRPYGPSRGITIADQARMGAPMYQLLCAHCHGGSGVTPRTSGYVVGIAPPDLSLIAQRNGGTVDMRRLLESIARCRRDDYGMQGGDAVLRLMGESAYMRAKHLENLAWYVESLQRRSP